MTHPHDAADDAALAARAATGDEAAFATLYDRYFGRIYDFVLRIVRDGDAAADATQLAFVRAWQALSGGAGPTTSAKSWLFAIARNAAIDETRRTSRLESFDGDREADESGARPWDVDHSRFANPDAVVRDSELAVLVWRAASALNPGDYALLDMHVRQELGAEEIAEALAMKPGAVYTRLSRLRDALEEAVGADLLARAGRRDCAALDQVLITVDIENGLDRAARRRVQRHLESCPTCEETRRRLVSPVALFGAFAPFAAPPGLQQDGLERALRAPRTAAPAVLPPAAERAAGRKSWVLGAAAAGIAVLIVVVLLLLLRGGDGASLALADPADVRSTSHQPGIASNERRVAVTWSKLASADAYSVSWDHDARGLPDDAADLQGDATGVTSETLGDGEWYFHLRTRNAEGRWTSTVHAGPFVVSSGAVSGLSPVASVDATPVRSPSPSAASPSPSPSPSPASSSATALPTIAPTAANTPSPTSTAAVAVPTGPPTPPPPPPTATATNTPVPNLPPVVGPITATLITPVTTYTVIATDPEGASLTYTWTWDGGCGVWTPAGNTATWSHPNGSPPAGCPHDSASHPASITVRVSDGVNAVTKTYSGSLPGSGPP